MPLGQSVGIRSHRAQTSLGPQDTSAWNQKARRGSRSQDFNIGTDIADSVTVSLSNAKDPNNITVEQRVIGEGNDAEELLPC